MSRKFDVISILLMIILILMLFMVIFKYFTSSSELISDLDSSITLQMSDDIVYSGDQNSVIISNIYESGNSKDSVTGSIININDNKEELPEQIIQEDSGDKDSNNSNEKEPNSKSEQTTLILTSADDISSKEKKEVLKELDQTLRELFDVIDSVQPIDETRLITDEGEVQE